MFLEIKGLLAPAEVQRLHQIAAQAKFVDGRISNPANETKVNQQVEMGSPLANEAAQLVMAALARSREFRDFAFPKIVAPPMLARYEPGMKYGAHFDAAYFGSASGQTLRSDVSATVFLNPPESYEGGELAVYQGSALTRFKLPPGDAIFYPSTMLHEVVPVSKGQRLVAITFIQSVVPDEAQRNLLYDLNEVAALEGLKMSWENRMRLEGVRANLLRRWSQA